MSPEKVRGYRAIIVVSSLALAVLVYSFWNISDTAPVGPVARTGVVALQTSMPREIPSGGIQPRPTDAARPPLQWGYTDREIVELVDAARPLFPSSPTLETFATYGDLLSWTLGHGQTDGSDDKALLCQVEYEPRMQQNCAWQNDYVVQRTGESTGEVVFLRARLDNDDDPACRAYASCVTAAYAARTDTPMPSEMGALSAFSVYGRGSNWRPSYGDRLQRYELLLSEANSIMATNTDSPLDPDDPTAPLRRYNYDFQEKQVRAWQKMVEHIKEMRQ